MFSIFGGGLYRTSKVAVLVVLICISTNLAAQDACLQRTVLVNVADAQGMPILGLTAADFKASHRGHEIKIYKVSYSEAPHKVVMLLDVSGSMAGNAVYYPSSDKWATARAAAMEFVTATGDKTPLLFITFTTRFETKIDPLTGRNAIVKWLNDSRVRDPHNLKGRTSLFGAILEAVSLLKPIRQGDAIYVITDGGDDSNPTSIRKVSHALQGGQVRLFASLLDTFRTVEERSGYDAFIDLANSSGGFVQILSPAELHGSATSTSDNGPEFAQVRSATAAIAAQIKGVYSFTLELPDSPSKPENWKLELVNTGNRKKKEVTVAYPHEIFPCNSQP